ncbi:hypothetical protein [Paracoccus yeei]|uniref:Uncharacterized protein n=1 Tax=Paracoccus yeei TaxID=147645 RepID=A0A5P2QRV7_9RHOB|nr:hypothetical protein [Paracoccus yeei]QEU08788.1 hypothetical protein FOB51_12720 [Paracoccus yeei]
MDGIKTIAPILITKTRSFWLGILPLALTLIDSVLASISAGGDGGPVAHLIAAVTRVDVETIRGWLLLISPVWGLIIAQQRAGITRPYTIDPAKERQIIEVVQDGKSAFEAGKAFGAAIKQRPGIIQAGSPTSPKPPLPPKKD